MKRVNLFLILLITAVTALIAATIIGFTLFSSNNQTDPYGWMSQMWGNHDNPNGHRGMMSQTSTPTPTTNSILPYYGILFAVLIATVIISIIGISYYLVYPQIRTSPALPPTTLNVPHTPQTTQTSNAYETLAKTLTEDERKIIAVLQAHNGKFLQKYIKAETGLSRLQTHRILARLAERGIVSLEKTGNTNQVALADWLN